MRETAPARGTCTRSSSSIPEFGFEDVRVDDAQILGGLGEGLELTKEWFVDERMMIAARCARRGRAVRSRSRSTYATEREQFGQPIVGYQGVGFQLADCAVELAGGARADVPDRLGDRPRRARRARRCTPRRRR